MLPNMPACVGDDPMSSMSAASTASDATATAGGDTTVVEGTSNDTAANPSRTMKEPTQSNAWGVSCFTIQSANNDNGMVSDNPETPPHGLLNTLRKYQQGTPRTNGGHSGAG
jgi:hypothetical protein